MVRSSRYPGSSPIMPRFNPEKMAERKDKRIITKSRHHSTVLEAEALSIAEEVEFIF